MSSSSIRGIAEKLGVSAATVSRSLNNSSDVSDALRERVLTEARRCGYELPRRTLRTGRIGIVFFKEGHVMRHLVCTGLMVAGVFLLVQ